MRLFLDVPFEEKDEVKALGARWNPKVKKWYADIFEGFGEWRKKYIRFAKWILRNRDEAIIANEYLYIIEAKRECWKCHKWTRVIGLGVGECVRLYIDFDGSIECDIYEDYIKPNEEKLIHRVHLAWTENEKTIPPKLLRYLKKNYSVGTGYSKFSNDYTFANHCDYCGALQGNWFMFNEPDSPLVPCVEGKDLEYRMCKIKIVGIPIYDDLQLDWEFFPHKNDYAYFEYGEYEEFILSSDPRNEYITYEELYS